MNSRTRLKQGTPIIGSWLCSASPIIAELMAATGLDFICVDVEHSAVDLAGTQSLFQAIRSGNPSCSPMVRLHGVDYAHVKRYLDAGARGVVAPLVCTREDAQTLVRAVKYPPQGERGVGFCRANDYGMRLEAEFNHANEENLIVVQIEHISAVANLDSILSVEGIDAVFIGPYDLSASMGITAQFDNPEYLKVQKQIQDACRRHGIIPGIHVIKPETENVRKVIDEGFRLIAYSLDITILTTHLKTAIPQLKELQK